MSKSLGFSLIELLVAISIIGLLAGVVITTSGAVQRQARDAQRQADLRTIQSSLQQYYADQQFYPTNITSTGETLRSDTGDGDPTTPYKIYLNKIPKDPINSSVYNYQKLPSVCNNSTNKCYSYCLYAQLEMPPVSSGCAPAGYFGVSQP